jgi:hypothetical protein
LSRTVRFAPVVGLVGVLLLTGCAGPLDTAGAKRIDDAGTPVTGADACALVATEFLGFASDVTEAGGLLEGGDFAGAAEAFADADATLAEASERLDDAELLGLVTDLRGSLTSFVDIFQNVDFDSGDLETLSAQLEELEAASAAMDTASVALDSYCA